MSGLLPAVGAGGGSSASGGLAGLLTSHALGQVLVGGVSGIVAMSTVIATGVVPLPPAPPQAPLALVGCPGSGSVVTVAQAGEKMLVTAKSQDGSWLRVYVPGPKARDGWVPATSVALLADGTSLPVAGCSDVKPATGTPAPTGTPGIAVASPTSSGAATPSASPTPTQKPTAKPTTALQTLAPTKAPPPPPTKAPTPTPNVGPVFASGPTPSVTEIFADPSGEGDCWGLPRRVSIKVVVSDPDGVAAVEFWVQKPGTSTFVKFSHPFFDHSTYWSSFVDAYYDHLNAGGTLSFYANAIDKKGASTKSPTKSIKVRQCDTDASVTWSIDLPQDSGGTYILHGNCVLGPVPWYFRISDPDGSVSSAVLSLTKTNYQGTTYQTVNLSHGAIYWYGESSTRDGITAVGWVLTATDAAGGTTVVSGSVTTSTDGCIK
jgi:hypothetical protein